ncbi:MAG: ABC transporter substrate-binding protein [Oscillospiraceae bacterium]|nr:ABC transporter substrate-binding protein [Oscillospiraceae bacterium]
MKRLLSILLAVALSAILLSACGGNTASHDGGDITIVQALDMVSWDPNATSDLSNGYVINNVYSKLFTFDENINGIPELTKEYTLVSDTEWHFTIYDNVKTHDGNILTADDVVYSLNRTKNGTIIGALFAPVNEITKVDEFTISITTNGPYPSLPTALTHQSTCIVPRSYIDHAEANDDWSHPIGTGRYTFGSRMIGDNIVLNRFEDYYDQSDKAMNNSLTFKIIPEGSARTIAVETGEADLNVDFSTMDYDMVQGNPDLTLHSHQSQSVWHLGMDCTNPNFQNILVRQAISFAIDRAAALEVGHNGHGTVMYNSSTIAPTCLGAVVNPLDMYEYNPDKAKELMAQAGVDGFSTEIIVFRDEAQRIATLVQANLAEIGIDATINRIENAVFADMLAANEVPMFITSWGAYWDPDMFLTRRFINEGGVNRSHYFNEGLEPLVLAGRASFDNNVRAEAYVKVQEFMAPEAPEVDMYVSIMFALARADLNGVEINVERPHNYYKLHY